MAQVATVVPRATDQLEVIDTLVNNAAVVAPLGAGHETDPADWSAALAVNVVAPAALSFAVPARGTREGVGRIVDVPSAVAADPAAMPGMNVYAAGKAALKAHTKALVAHLHSDVTGEVWDLPVPVTDS